MRIRRLAVLAALAGAGATVVPATASAATTPRLLRADVQIKKFVATRAGLTALGTQTATLAGASARKQVTLSVAKSSSCSILTLNLKQLNLQLLGLNLVTGEINLRITGRTDGTLGQLFCRLARGLKIASATASHTARAVAATLNRRLRHRPMHALRVQARLPIVTADAAQAAPSCKVLDLILGPLNLDLLGLVVDLYGPTNTQPVQVHVTADPTGGVLGAVFCKLAFGQPAG
jgi:hypothetical protein